MTFLKVSKVEESTLKKVDRIGDRVVKQYSGEPNFPGNRAFAI